jgi:hypothetical protein
LLTGREFFSAFEAMTAAYPDMAAAIIIPTALMISFTVYDYAFGVVFAPARPEAMIDDKMAR